MKKILLILILFIAVTANAQYYGTTTARNGYFNYIVTDSISLTGIAYGSAYISSDKPDTVVVTSSSDYYTVGRSAKYNSGGILKNVTVQDTSLTVSVSGKYQVSYSFSFQTVTGVTNGTFQFAITKNDTVQAKTISRRLLSGTNDLGIGATAPTILQLYAGDIIKLKLQSPTDNSNTVVFQTCIVHINKVDN